MTLGIMTFSIAMLSTNDNRDNDAQNNIKKFYDLVIMMILVILRVIMLSMIMLGTILLSVIKLSATITNALNSVSLC
jgi:hypothetical protein